jgi:alpha-galactosidase
MACFVVLLGGAAAARGEDARAALARVEQILQVPYPAAAPSEPTKEPVLQLLRQDFEELEINRSVIKTPMKIGTKPFQRGLGTHSVGHIRVTSPQPMARLLASIGVDNNQRTEGKRGSVVFSVSADGRERFRSGVLRAGQEPQPIDVELGGATVLDLKVGDAGDDPSWDHADWAEARVVTQDGKTLWLDELKRHPDTRLCRYPFSFVYGGRHSDELLPGWKRLVKGLSVDADRSQSVTGGLSQFSRSRAPTGGWSATVPLGNRTITTWADPQTGLVVEWHVTQYRDFPAADWVLYFRNDGQKDTPILADVQALDLALDEPIGGAACYRLHRTNGAPSNPTDFEPTLVSMDQGSSQGLSGGAGRSSNKDFPFVKIESGKASYIVAVGWSGQWAMRLNCRQDRRLHATAGLEITHFKLHPGERVRTPRVLMLCWPGDTLESNARFRQLIYKHYVARRSGQRPLPTLFCNTCFTRGGGWLNECNAENQISLIRAYAPLGLEALITDAGWFEGGWPAGAGNWNPRKDAYPQGMAPVAAAAKGHGMAYGLWFEFERVVPGTWLHRNRPQWLLSTGKQAQGTYLLNLGLPEVRQYLFGIVKEFMDLPGFRFYRSDFNMDPLPYWRFSDPPDRQGITEMKYIEGLYDFWDRLARAWPDALREECASGGRRIDLETIMRMHLHQESDYWFDNQVDAAVIWSLSRYLPNGTFTTPLVRLDDRSFHSTLACSLIPGWIADAKDFDRARAKQLTDAYRRLRHLLVGAWYPLAPYSRDGKHWMAMQFHRPDLGEGLILVIPPLKSAQRSVKLVLHGLDPEASYELDWQVGGRKTTARGSALTEQFEATVPPGDGGERIVYRISK